MIFNPTVTKTSGSGAGYKLFQFKITNGVSGPMRSEESNILLNDMDNKNWCLTLGLEGESHAGIGSGTGAGAIVYVANSQTYFLTDLYHGTDVTFQDITGEVLITQDESGRIVIDNQATVSEGNWFFPSATLILFD